MGLLDSVLGAAVGGALGRGGFGGGGLGGGVMRGGRGGLLGSPVVKALLLALAAKAAQEYMSRNRAGAATSGGRPDIPNASEPEGGGLGGVLGSILGGGQGGGLGGLGGLLGGLGGAGVLGELVEQFNRRGHADAVNSWVASGPNQPIAPQALAEALGPDNLAQLEQETGMPQPQLLEELSRELPDAIDHITPQGRLPSDVELLHDGG